MARGAARRVGRSRPAGNSVTSRDTRPVIHRGVREGLTRIKYLRRAFIAVVAGRPAPAAATVREDLAVCWARADAVGLHAAPPLRPPTTGERVAGVAVVLLTGVVVDRAVQEEAWRGAWVIREHLVPCLTERGYAALPRGAHGELPRRPGATPVEHQPVR